MLDREVVRQFLGCHLAEIEIEIPEDIDKDSLVETFCQCVEEDYYEWLKDNFKWFFDHGDPDWVLIRERVKRAGRDSIR